VKIGFHLPIAKGFEHTYRQAEHLGCEIAQIFVKNPRSWARKTWSDRDRETFARLFRDIPVVAHLSYLPNIAKSDEQPVNREAFLHEATLCAQLGIANLVVHCGSREDTEKGIEIAAWTITQALSDSPVSVLLENSAGQGNAIGKNLRELAAIFEQTGGQERVGFCLDTAHLFAAGYDIRKQSVWDDIITELEERCGPGRIKLFHLNDSKSPSASAVDRHWHIGEGEIGLECFRFLVNEKKFAHLGGVMETPKMGKMDEENMKTMRSLLSPLVPGPSS
jgi:apurinic endonuclease APN1